MNNVIAVKDCNLVGQRAVVGGTNRNLLGTRAVLGTTYDDLAAVDNARLLERYRRDLGIGGSNVSTLR